MLLVVFGALALLAAYATWGDEDLRWVGVCLLGGCVASNIMHATMNVAEFILYDRALGADELVALYERRKAVMAGLGITVV